MCNGTSEDLVANVSRFRVRCFASPRNDGGTGEAGSAAASALCAEIRPAIGVDRLPRDVTRGGAAQEADHRRDVVRLAALARDRAVGQRA